MSVLKIEPESEVHFRLNDETPKCGLSLSHIQPGAPIAFRIQPSQRYRYAIWPSVGVAVDQESHVSISIVLLEHARTELKNSFRKLGPLAEFRQMDQIIVEWCKAPAELYDQLCGDEDQDFEILSTFWNTRGYAFSAPVVCERQAMRVRFSAYDDVTPSRNTIPPTVSMDESASQDESLVIDSIESQRKSEDVHRTDTLRQPQHDDKVITNLQQWGQKQESCSTIHKYQLQQTLRCSGCYQLHSTDPSEDAIPVMSQACGHSVCRGCIIRSENDLHPSPGLIPCPVCQTQHAFGMELHINHSLCAVIDLLDS